MDAQMEKLREQLMQAAQAFSTDAEALGELLQEMVADVERAESEPLEIVPVAHHSPACGLHMLRRLQSVRPRVIFIELCEDMRPLLPKLGECRLPVALQAFASESHAFPTDWAPLTVVAPITEFSAEYQAMSYALTHGVELVLVDRSVDHVFQQLPQEEGALEEELPDEEEFSAKDDEDEGRISHGSALGIQLGSVKPTFEAFEEFLLKNAHVRHFSEWWEQYVENTVIHADWDTYRRVMCLVGSLLRRLGRRPQDVESDRWRERYMWTRMKQYMKEHKLKPSEAIYVCGAIHAVSDVEEYGTHSDAVFDIPPRTETEWLYGLIPSSFSAIERQFSHPSGTVSLAESTWKKGLDAAKLKSFSIPKDPKNIKPAPAPKVIAGETERDLNSFLVDPPEGVQADEAQLLGWCVEVVKLARKNSYLATTADSIAIYQTSLLLAGMRNRRHPSPYDFRDAAVTCLEKEKVPGKRDISWICDILLGGDRYGAVGYESLPPLARNVYDRLAVLPINLMATTVQRALMDFKQHPEYLPASDLLWKLAYLSGPSAVRPIMGERTLGHVPLQESWDITIGKNQRSVIELGYEGVTVEQVLDLRLKRKAFAPDATTLDALQVTEDSILYLKSKRLTEEMGQRAVQLLRQETGATSAPQIFERVRRLVHYYRAQPDGLSKWIEDFVSSGYSHYATLLPEAFADRDTSPQEIAAMLGFIFTLESLALSLGCDRSQLLIAIRQANDVEISPDKIGLLWSAQYLLGERSIEQIRAFFDDALGNELLVPALPNYIMGFVLALRFTPLVGRLVVELMSKAFARLPDRILMPWLPNLIMTLKPLSGELMPLLLKEASGSFPGNLKGLESWVAPWEREVPKLDLDFGKSEVARDAQAADVPDLSTDELAARALLIANRDAGEALCAVLGLEGEWREELAAPVAAQPAGPVLSPQESAARAMLFEHRAAGEALCAVLGLEQEWGEALSVGEEAVEPPKAERGVVQALIDAHPASLDAVVQALT